MRVALSVLVPLLCGAASAQTFRPAGGPWTRAHTLVGSAPDVRIFAAVGPRLGVTVDGGRTWSVVSETAAPRRLVTDGDALLGAFATGIRRSTDRGATWTPDGLDGQNVLDVAVDAGAEYALVAAGLFRRGPGGDWVPVVLPRTSVARYTHLAAAAGSVALSGLSLSFCNGRTPSTVQLRSRNGGATWASAIGGGSPAGVAAAPDGTVWFTSSTAEGCFSVGNPGALHRMGPVDAAPILVQSGNFGGVAVNASGAPVTDLPGPDGPNSLGRIVVAGAFVIAESQASGACDPDPPCSFVYDSGLYAALDGRPAPTGFVPSPVRALAVVRDTLAVAADGAVFREDAGGVTLWTELGNARAFVVAPGEPTRMVAVSPLAFDGFRTPGTAYVGEPSGRRPVPLGGVAGVAAVRAGVAVVVAAVLPYAGCGLYVFSGRSPALAAEYRDLGSLGAAGTTLYAGAVTGLWRNCGSRLPPARILVSTNDGGSWAPDAVGMTATDVHAFGSLGSGAARLDFAGTNAGVFARTPGAPWQADGLAGRTVFALYPAPAGILAGTDDGLFVRDAAGAWVRYGAGLDGRTVYAVLAATNAGGAWLGVGTDAGLFETRPFVVAGEAPVATRATALTVATLPNPARGRRTVRIDGASAERVTVDVLDLLGRIAAHLGEVVATNGRAEVSWDASALPPGVYVVRVAAGAERTSVRAVVLR